MDLLKLKQHEDHMKMAVDPLPRIEQLIALNYLRRVIGLNEDMTDRTIEKEYREELKKSKGE